MMLQPVVAGGEGFGFRADPCGGDQHAGCCPLFFHRSGQCPDVVGGYALAVSLGLDQDLGLVHDVGLVVGDGVDSLVAGGLCYAHFHAHGLEELADEVLELVPVHLQQVRAGVDPGQGIDRVGETVLGLLELDDRLYGLQVVGVR